MFAMPLIAHIPAILVGGVVAVLVALATSKKKGG